MKKFSYKVIKAIITIIACLSFLLMVAESDNIIIQVVTSLGALAVFFISSAILSKMDSIKVEE